MRIWFFLYISPVKRYIFIPMPFILFYSKYMWIRKERLFIPSLFALEKKRLFNAKLMCIRKENFMETKGA
jgi:hypothetical protein